MTPRLQRRVREAHPECSFARMKGAPLRFAKKRPEGVAERRALLAAHFGDIGALRGAAVDDVLDAYALLWTAGRVAAGAAQVLGAGERDARGLRCEIVA